MAFSVFLTPQELSIKSCLQLVLITATLALLIHIGITVTYRLFIHPLRNIPGPRLAAVSDLYGFYHNFFQEGYSKQLEALHGQYGSTVVRIGPNHVHVNSCDYFEEVFRIGSKYPKDPSFYKHFGRLDGMTDVEDFRTYRAHIASLYSAKSANGLVPKLLTEIRAVSERLEQCIGTNEVVNIQQMFRTLGAGMILHLLFPQDISLLEFDGYHPFLAAFDVLMTKTWLILNYPLAIMPLSLIPRSGYGHFKSASAEFTKYCEGWAKEAELLLNETDKQSRDSHMTRYLNIDPADRKKGKAVPHPLEDIFNFVAGGSDTTAYSASCAVHYILSSPDVLKKLQVELDESLAFIRYSFDHKKVQSLPYLSAVVKETLRLCSPVPGCLPRIVPEGGARVGSVYIPAGIAVSVSLLSIQQNAELFPEPQQFRPERWLGEGKEIEKWNVAFSRGPRQCIGANMAYLELHAYLAYLFSHFEFKLSGTRGKKLEWVDRFVATNTEEVKVTVLKNRWG